MERRIIVAGSGGQGILFFGKLLARAAMIEGREVTCFPSYGAEMRGGTANCTIILSDCMICSPVIRNPGVLVVMNEASYKRFADKLSPGGILIYDSSRINAKLHREDVTAVGIAAGDIASSMNCPKSANMAMLGAFIAATGLPGLDSALRAADESALFHHKDMLTVNKDVIRKGYDSFRLA